MKKVRNVSIPHRFNSHNFFVPLSHSQNLRFNPSQVQFTLISLNPSTFSPKPFQSLAGSIHTKITTRRKFIKEKFQSLTGSIHTLDFEDLIYYINSVSIPHRFNSHPFPSDKPRETIPCFNPSQVQFTHLRL